MSETLIRKVGNVLADHLNRTTLLVWYDVGGTLQDLIGSTVPADTQFIIFEGSYLKIRAQIEKERDFSKKRLIYVPEAAPSPSWLRDYEIFGSRLDISLIDLLRDVYQVKLTDTLKEILTPENCRRLVRKWRQVLGTADVVRLSEKRLKRALLAACFEQPHQFDPKRAILVYITYAEDLSRKLGSYGLTETFAEVLVQDHGMRLPPAESLEARRMAVTILLTEVVLHSGGLGRDEFSDILPSEGQREFWADLALQWASSIDFRDSFVEWSRIIEDDYDISGKIRGKTGIENVLGFMAVDRALLEEVKARTRDRGRQGILRNANFISNLASTRSKMIWTKAGILKDWRVISTSVDLLKSVEKSLKEIGQVSEIGSLMKSYTDDEGWWRIDNLYRELAAVDGDVDHEVHDLFIREAAAAYQEWLRRLGNSFSTALQNNKTWPITDIPIQTSFWSFFMYPHKERVAIFFIDAMRYELQRGVRERLLESGLHVQHHAMLSALPSVTEIGMSCLLPHEVISVHVSDKTLQVLVDDKKTVTKADRQKFLRERYGEDVAVADLDSITDPKALVRKSKGTKLLVVMDREIDRAGSFISEALLSDFDKLSDRVRKAVEVVIQAGYDRVLITTDHGFLFLPDPSQVEAVSMPSSSDTLVGSRYAVGHPLNVKGIFMLSLSDLGYVTPRLIAAFPFGVSTFSRRGPREAFVHGGTTLQECCIGVLEVTPGKRVAKEKVDR